MTLKGGKSVCDSPHNTRHFPQPGYLQIRRGEKTLPQEAYQQRWLSQLLRIYLDCPGSQHLCFNWKLDSYDFSKPYHSFHFFLVLFVIYLLFINVFTYILSNIKKSIF